MKKNLILTSLAALVATSAANAAPYTGADLTFGGETPAYTGTPSIDAEGKVAGIEARPVKYNFKTWDSVKEEYVLKSDDDAADTTTAYTAQYKGGYDSSVADGAEHSFYNSALADGTRVEKTAKDFTGVLDNNAGDVKSNSKIFDAEGKFKFDGTVSAGVINQNDYFYTLNGEQVNLTYEGFNKSEKFNVLNYGDESFVKANEDNTTYGQHVNKISAVKSELTSVRGALEDEDFDMNSNFVLNSSNGHRYSKDENGDVYDLATQSKVNVADFTQDVQKEFAALDAAIAYANSALTAVNANTEFEDNETRDAYLALTARYEADRDAVADVLEDYATYKEALSVYKSNEASKEAALAKLESNTKNAANIAKANMALEEASILDVIDNEATSIAKTEANRALDAAKAYADAGDARTLAAANAYTDKKVDTLEKDISGGVAAATALSAVNVSGVSKGEVSVGGGYGYYNGESAVAFGAAMGLTDRWSVNAGAGIASGNDTQVSFRAGTNYKFKLF